MATEVGPEILKGCWKAVWAVLEGDTRFTDLVPVNRRDKTQYLAPIRPVDASMIGDTPRVRVLVKQADSNANETTSTAQLSVGLVVLVESTDQGASQASAVAEAVWRVLAKLPHVRSDYTINGQQFIRNVTIGAASMESGHGWRFVVPVEVDCNFGRQWYVFGS